MLLGLKKQQQPQQQEQSNNNIDIVIEYFGDNGDILKILCYMIKNNQMDKFLKYKNFLLDKNDMNEIDSEEIDNDKRNMIIDFFNNTENNEIIENVFNMIENDMNENKNDVFEHTCWCWQETLIFLL